MTKRFSQDSNSGSKSPKTQSAAAGEWNDDVLFKIKDPDFALRIKKQMRARLDLEEVMLDPDLTKTRIATGKIVDEYRISESDCESARFIKDALAGKKSVSGTKVIELEKSDINQLSAEWVKEWHRKQQMQVPPSPGEQERKDFIRSSMEAEMDSKPEVIELPVKGKRSYIGLKSASLAAAVIIGALLLIKTLIPASEGALFNTYYQPFDALPSTVRSGVANADLFSSALENYRKSNYTEAELQFSGSMNGSVYDRASFFLGLTELAQGNYNDAVPHFESVILNDEQYRKDAQWYLGLACLKNGRKEMAIQCFEALSKDSGFYSARAGKIVRRIK